MKERLEQLDQFEEDENDVVETVTMTQKDFIKIIEKFHKNLESAWGSDQRRDALRIAIKVRRRTTARPAVCPFIVPNTHFLTMKPLWFV